MRLFDLPPHCLLVDWKRPTLGAILVLCGLVNLFGWLGLESQAAPKAPRTSQVKANAPRSNATIHPIFQPVMAILKKKSPFPVMLPTMFPFEEPPHAVLEKASAKKYSIILGYTAFCSGASSCRYGSLKGELVGKVAPKLKGQKIALAKGLEGYFVDGPCKGECQDSTLSWKQGAVLYTAGIKGGRLQDLTRLVNSMILNGSV